jgi:hypothetical protein
MSPTVLVAAATPEAQRVELRSLCRSLHFEALELRAGEAVHHAATVVAGSLPAGARTIPRDLLEALDRAQSNATILLLASEQLVRPVVTLQEGRIVVIASSTSSARLRGILQMVTPDDPAPSLWRPLLSAFAWSAHARPVTCSNNDAGIHAVVPFSGHAPHVETMALLLGTRDLDGVRAIAARHAREAGLVCMARSAREWCIHWPRVDRQAWLYSNVRLPHVMDLRSAAANAEGNLLCFPAHPGDVAVLLSHPIHAASELPLALAEGGPAVIERVDGTTGGLVVEVR